MLDARSDPAIGRRGRAQLHILRRGQYCNLSSTQFVFSHTITVLRRFSSRRWPSLPSRFIKALVMASAAPASAQPTPQSTGESKKPTPTIAPDETAFQAALEEQTKKLEETKRLVVSNSINASDTCCVFSEAGSLPSRVRAVEIRATPVMGSNKVHCTSKLIQQAF